MTDPSNAAMTSTPTVEAAAWRYISGVKGAKWTVQKNYPADAAKWAAYTVEPLFARQPVSQPEQKPVAVKAAKWRERGQPDPHGSRYDCERAALCGGSMTDDQIANGVFLNPSIGNLTAAKDRIRWLSRSLEAALAPPVAVKDDTARSPLASVTEQAVEAAAKALWTNLIGDNKPSRIDVITYTDAAEAALTAALPHLSSPQSQPHPVAGEGVTAARVWNDAADLAAVWQTSGPHMNTCLQLASVMRTRAIAALPEQGGEG